MDGKSRRYEGQKRGDGGEMFRKKTEQETDINMNREKVQEEAEHLCRHGDEGKHARR